MKTTHKWVGIVCLLCSICSIQLQAGTLTWEEDRARAFQQARYHGKLVLMLGGWSGCPNCQYMKNTVCENAEVKAILEKHYILWYLRIKDTNGTKIPTNNSLFWGYATGQGRVTLPQICVIDPNNEANRNYIDRSFSSQNKTTFLNRITSHVPTHLRPSTVTSPQIAGAGLTSTISWIGHTDFNFGGAVILRSSDGVVTTQTLTDEANYSVGTTVGNAKVVYNGSSTSFRDTDITVGTHYFYKIFSKGKTGYYSTSSAGVDAIRGVDNDTNGIDDNWEQKFVTQGVSLNPNADDDKDGLTNSEEYLLSMNPAISSEDQQKLNPLKKQLIIYPGWNLVSSPKVTDQNCQDFFAAVSDGSIWKWNSATQKYIDVSKEKIATTFGYWVFANSTKVLALE